MDIEVLLVGDVVGKPGRGVLKSVLPAYIEREGIDFVIVNGENAAQGSGITENLFKEIMRAGADVVTTGDHTWRRREVLPLLKKECRALRPANYPPRAEGRGLGVFESRSGVPVGIVTVVGRIFMAPADCPFRAVQAALEDLEPRTVVRFLEVHAEATSEKLALAWKFAGRFSGIFGTHTHVPTADERILPGGTAYITDLGMTGPYDSVIGRKKESVIYKFETSMHAPFDVALGDVHLSGARVRVDTETGRAKAIERVWLDASET